jgi:hypothetical protein
MLETMAQNPCRVPDWRWRRAQDIVDGHGLPATVRREGATSAVQIGRAARFYKALLHCDSDEQLQMKLAWECPNIFWPHYLYNQPHNPSRWVVEAHLLAGETDQKIASRIGCSEEYIRTYEALFFNVREKLNCTDYISNVVLKDVVVRGLHERDKDLLWKLMAYTYGSQVLDAVINPLGNLHCVDSSDDIWDFFQESAIDVIKKKAAIAAVSVPINSKTEMKLIKVFGKFVELERSNNSQGEATDQIIKGIGAMLNILPFRVGSMEAAKGQAGTLQYDHGAVELCQDELMCVAAGYSLPADKLLKQLKFPEQIAP